MNVNNGSSSVLRGQTAAPRWGKTADVGETVPAEGHHGEGEHQPGGPEGQRVQAAEGQANFPFPCGEGVADIDGRYRLHQEGDHKVGETNIGEEKVVGVLLQTVLITDGAHNHQVDEDPNNSQCHLHYYQHDDPLLVAEHDLLLARLIIIHLVLVLLDKTIFLAKSIC